MELNQIFYEEDYDIAVSYCSENNYTIQEIESDENGRRFQVIEIPQLTEIELATHEIRELKYKLMETDYQAIKYAESAISEEEYAEIKAQRQAWRDKINELESIILNESNEQQ